MQISFFSYLARYKSLVATALFFRYINFPIGSVQEHEIIAVASCCTQGMKLRATDVAGVEAIQEAEYKVATLLTAFSREDPTSEK